jgi:hypothetical protein
MRRALQRRLTDLQSNTGLRLAEGCDTCRHYPGIVIRDDAGNLSRPERCPDCGREVAIFRILHIVGVPLDVP